MTIGSSCPCGVIAIFIYTNRNYNFSKIAIYFEFFKVFIHLFSRNTRSKAAKINTEQYMAVTDI